MKIRDDGFLDLYLSNNGTANNLYMSNAGNSNNWIVMKLEGVISNRSAIGARVKIVAEGQSQIREVQGGSGHNSQHSLPVEFGVGQAAIIDSIVINWPSGIEQIVTGITINQLLDIKEQYPTPTEEYPVIASANCLQNNYPNPFVETTFIPITIPQPQHVKLVICDQLSRELVVLLDEDLPTGSYTIRWDAAGYKKGVYYCRLVMNNFMGIRKLILVD